MREAVIVEAVRPPVGRHGGALAPVRPDDLAALVIAAASEAAQIGSYCTVFTATEILN